MDLLVEKLDGSRYYLSQYKVLITDFEESAPSVTRNSKQLDQRNGNIDFGGWHTDKTINITGYYRADDMDEEEELRERLYALLSDPEGYYITQLKTTPDTVVERPGETSGGYYDKLTNYPSHKRFLVYTEAPELELVGNVNGTLLYKLSVEFKTIKLPYGETPVKDVAIDSPYKDVPSNKIINSSKDLVVGQSNALLYTVIPTQLSEMHGNYTFSSQVINANAGQTSVTIGRCDPSNGDNNIETTDVPIVNGHVTKTFTGLSHPNWTAILVYPNSGGWIGSNGKVITYHHYKLQYGTSATDWSPNPADPEYNSWYYSLDSNVSVPYSGSVSCNQLEQGFAIELTTLSSASSLSFKIGDAELTYNGDVAKGDVLRFSGFSYTKNNLSIVDKTNKAYFVLRPDKPNRITCNVLGKVRVLGFQNFYA